MRKSWLYSKKNGQGQSGTLRDDKRVTQQEDIVTLHVCGPKKRAEQYVRQRLTERKEGREKSIVTVGDLSARLSTADGTTRQKTVSIIAVRRWNNSTALSVNRIWRTFIPTAVPTEHRPRYANPGMQKWPQEFFKNWHPPESVLQSQQS